MKKIQLGFPSFLLVVVAAIILTGITRLISFYVPFMSNFTPMGAMAIFGGTYFAQKWKAGLLSVITLFVTDIFINYLYTAKLIVWYGNSALWLYASLIIMVFIGSMIKKVNVTSVLLASLASVAVHWLLTDIEPWINSSYYAKGLLGYGESLLMAIPFERNMLIADAVFGAALYGGYEVFKARAIAKADVARQAISTTASY